MTITNKDLLNISKALGRDKASIIFSFIEHEGEELFQFVPVLPLKFDFSEEQMNQIGLAIQATFWLLGREKERVLEYAEKFSIDILENMEVPLENTSFEDIALPDIRFLEPKGTA